MCQICNQGLIKGEIVYFCTCGRFIHTNCFKIGKTNCEDCNLPFKVGSYELDHSYNGNNSTIDTNINNLENYDELTGMAMHMSSENMVEIISKKDNSFYEDYRMALSPINLTNTPYSGKWKGLSSNQKVEQFMKQQSN
jgi:hypothetical protein